MLGPVWLRIDLEWHFGRTKPIGNRGKTPGGALELSYAHPAYARGIYTVDAGAHETLRKSGAL